MLTDDFKHVDDDLYDAYFRLLTLLYTEHNPSKVDNVHKLLKKYSKNLHALYKKICKKYAVKPIKQKDVLKWREEEIAQEESEAVQESEEDSEYSYEEPEKVQNETEEEEEEAEEEVADETDIKQGPGENDDLSAALSHQETMQFFQQDFNDNSIDLSEGSTISVMGRTIIFQENVKASIGTQNDADGATIDFISTKSDEFISVFNNKNWSKIPTLFSQDCVISVSDRNYYGREAAEIVFKAIRTQAGKNKSGCGPTLKVQRASFEILSKKQIRENGTYEHDLQPDLRQYSFTWKLERDRYQIFLFQW